MLVKDDVGKSKPCTVRLPPSGFVYGKPENKIELRGSIISGNYEGAPVNQSTRAMKPIVDFRKLNKASAF